MLTYNITEVILIICNISQLDSKYQMTDIHKHVASMIHHTIYHFGFLQLN